MAERKKKPKITYQEYLVKVKDYLEKHGKNGVMFVLKYDKWLDIFYTTHDRAYEELIKDERFLTEAGVVTAEDPEKRKAVRSARIKAARQKKEAEK